MTTQRLALTDTGQVAPVLLGADESEEVESVLFASSLSEWPVTPTEFGHNLLLLTAYCSRGTGRRLFCRLLAATNTQPHVYLSGCEEQEEITVRPGILAKNGVVTLLPSCQDGDGVCTEWGGPRVPRAVPCQRRHLREATHREAPR